MGILRDMDEMTPMDPYQSLTLKVSNRTHDEENAWSARLENFFKPELDAIKTSINDANREVFGQALRVVHGNRTAIDAALLGKLGLSREGIEAFMAQLLALYRDADFAQPTRDEVRTFKLSAIRGEHNTPSSREPGVRILLRSQALESMPELSQHIEGKENDYCASLVLPRGGYDATDLSQGTVSLFLDHESAPNPVGDPFEIKFICPIAIPSDSFVASHSLTREGGKADFFQNPRFYPNGEKNPYRDPQLLAKMAEHDVKFDNGAIFHNPWLEERDTFGKYDR